MKAPRPCNFLAGELRIYYAQDEQTCGACGKKAACVATTLHFYRGPTDAMWLCAGCKFAAERFVTDPVTKKIASWIVGDVAHLAAEEAAYECSSAERARQYARRPG